MCVKAKYTTAGMTKDKCYDVIRQGNDLLIKNGLIQIVLDDGTIGLRAFNAFDVVES